MKRVLITAGADGIGLCMAKAFAARGDRVLVTDIDQDNIASLPAGIRGSLVDASEEPAMDALFREISQEWGGLDVLCSNAGIRGRRRRSKIWTWRRGTNTWQSISMGR